jgi:hypothetical protein
LKIDLTKFEDLKIGDIISRLGADIEMVGNLIINFLSFFIRNSIMLIGAITLMFIESPKLSLMVVFSIPVLLFPILKLSKHVRSLSKRVLEEQSLLASNIEENLPFKIFICIPKTGLSFQRQDNMIFNENGKIMANGQIMGVSYNDQNLLESTTLEVTHKYIEESLEEDLLLFKNGKLNKLSSNNEKTKWLDSEQIKRIDKEKISEILNLRSFVFQNNENAADFLDNITNKNTIKRKNDKPQLPI